MTRTTLLSLLALACLIGGLVCQFLAIRLGRPEHLTQHGTIRIPAGITSQTATITAVDTTRTRLDVPTYGEPGVRLELTNSTTITATLAAPATHDIEQRWRLREWTK